MTREKYTEALFAQRIDKINIRELRIKMQCLMSD